MNLPLINDIVLSEILQSHRRCGECTACCYALAMQEFGKPYYCNCEHVCNGCNIYATRPLSCVSYQCIWLQEPGLLSDAERPDKLGAVYHLDEDNHGIWLEILLIRELSNDEIADIIEKAFFMFEKSKLLLRGVRVYLDRSIVATKFKTDKTKYTNAGEDNGDGHRDFGSNDGILYLFEGERR